LEGSEAFVKPLWSRELVQTVKELREEYSMVVVYKFYLRDPERGDVLIGVLPERRRSPQRITQEAIMNWVKKMPFDKGINGNDIYFISVEA
jgi:hypothetical protein